MALVSTLGRYALICTLAGVAVVLSGCGPSGPTPAPTPAPGPCKIANCSKVSDAQSCSEATCEECSPDSVPDCNSVATPKGTKDCAAQAICKDCKPDAIAHCAATETPSGTKNCKKDATCKTCENKYTQFSDSQGNYCGLSCPLPNCQERGATPRDAKSCDEVTSPCSLCHKGYEFTLNKTTLLSNGACSPECSDDQIKNGCARNTCNADGSCECVPGFTLAPVDAATEPSIARFLGDTPRTSSCVKDNKETKMTFYMYRAQNDEDYPPDCTDLASAAGVLYYLHNEVVKYCYENQDVGNPPVPKKFPRHNGITRIIRYKVDVLNTAAVFDKQQGQFSQYVPFDKGQCTWQNNKCGPIWKTYGFSVGCQKLGIDKSANRAYADCAWYSLPGACPSQNYSAKDATCKKSEPGGNCSSVTGDNTCTWHVYNQTGESIYLDELSGIWDSVNPGKPFKYDPKFYLNWCTGGLGGKHGGHTEYDPKTDKGIGNDFWDGILNETKNKERVLAVQRLFAKNFPSKDALTENAQPVCDGF